MRVLVIGGNRFVGLRVSQHLSRIPQIELHILNRTGQAARCPNAVLHKGDRRDLKTAHLDRDWDVVYDFACFNEAEARDAVSFFGHVGRYVFISTMSVYDFGAGLKESAFDPMTWVAPPEPGEKTYQYGKRQAESIFFQAAEFPVVGVRFPFILGPDDYTHRLSFHTDRMKRGESIWAPNFDAKFSAVHSQDAAEFLIWTLRQTHKGPLNVAPTDSITVGELLERAERILMRSSHRAGKELPDSGSPYGVEKTLTMDVSAAKKIGFEARPISSWIDDLLELEREDGSSGYLH